MKDMRAIYFDMDGTIANLYNVNGWLEDIRAERVRPYKEAETMVRMATLARLLNRLQRNGYTIGIVSWLAKNGTEAYNKAVTEAKKEWLKEHLTSVNFNEIHIVEYGTPKENIVDFPDGILFDDEEANRNNWKGTAYNVNNIIEVLKGLA